MATMATGLLLTACDDSEGGATSGEEGDVIQLSFWHMFGGNAEEHIEDTIQEFNETIGEEEGIEVEAVYQGDGDDLMTALRAAVQANDVENLPDIVIGSPMDAGYIRDTPYHVPVQELIDADGEFDLDVIEPNVLQAFSFQDELLAMPFGNSTPVLYYNADMLEEAGFDGPPETVEELGEIAAAMGEITGYYGFTASLDQYHYGTWFGQQGSYIGNNRDGRDDIMTEVIFDQEGTMEATLEAWGNAVDMGGIITGEDVDAGEEFAAETIGMYVGSIAGVADALSRVDGNFDLQTAYMPKVHEEDDDGAAVGGRASWVMDRYEDEERLEAATEFLKFYASPEVQFSWHQATGYFPINIETHDLPEMQEHLEENPQFEVGIAQLHDSSPEVQEPMHSVPGEVNTILRDGTLAYVNGEMTLEEAVEYMAEEANSALEEYNRANP